jgi:hypothetical protein
LEGSEAVIRERVREIIEMVRPEEMAGLGAPRRGRMAEQGGYKPWGLVEFTGKVQ